jgi:hypothetical protein
VQPDDIKPKQIYAGARWKGDRQVVEVARHRGQEAVVHYVDLRTQRTGNALLSQFAASAERTVP